MNKLKKMLISIFLLKLSTATALSLHEAAEKNNYERVVELIEGRICEDIDERDRDMHSALFIAALKGHLEIVKFLLKNNAEPEFPIHKFGLDRFLTPFSVAIDWGHWEIVNEMLKSTISKKQLFIKSNIIALCKSFDRFKEHIKTDFTIEQLMSIPDLNE